MVTLTETSAFTIHPCNINKHPNVPVFVRSDGKVFKYTAKRFKLDIWTDGSFRKSGYRSIQVLGKNYLVHRLVAETFITNPYNKPTVDHINGKRSDNRVENLEWCTLAEQAQNKHSLDDLNGEPWLQYKYIYAKQNADTYRRHKDSRKVYRQAKYQSNKEEICEKQKQYDALHREERIAYYRKYHKENREKRLLQMRANYQKRKQSASA